METKKQIMMLALVTVLLSSVLSEAMEIRQEMYTFQIGVTRESTCTTFVINELHQLTKPPATSCSLPLIHFELGSSGLSLSAEKRILSGLKKCNITPTTPLVITGYTCERGSDQTNQTLSRQRAKVVADFLRRHGVTQTVYRAKDLKNLSHLILRDCMKTGE